MRSGRLRQDYTSPTASTFDRSRPRPVLSRLPRSADARLGHAAAGEGREPWSPLAQPVGHLARHQSRSRSTPTTPTDNLDVTIDVGRSVSAHACVADSYEAGDEDLAEWDASLRAQLERLNHSLIPALQLLVDVVAGVCAVLMAAARALQRLWRGEPVASAPSTREHHAASDEELSASEIDDDSPPLSPALSEAESLASAAPTMIYTPATGSPPRDHDDEDFAGQLAGSALALIHPSLQHTFGDAFVDASPTRLEFQNERSEHWRHLVKNELQGIAMQQGEAALDTSSLFGCADRHLRIDAPAVAGASPGLRMGTLTGLARREAEGVATQQQIEARWPDRKDPVRRAIVNCLQRDAAVQAMVEAANEAELSTLGYSVAPAQLDWRRAQAYCWLTPVPDGSAILNIGALLPDHSTVRVEKYHSSFYRLSGAAYLGIEVTLSLDEEEDRVAVEVQGHWHLAHATYLPHRSTPLASPSLPPTPGVTLRTDRRFFLEGQYENAETTAQIPAPPPPRRPKLS